MHAQLMRRGHVQMSRAALLLTLPPCPSLTHVPSWRFPSLWPRESWAGVRCRRSAWWVARVIHARERAFLRPTLDPQNMISLVPLALILGDVTEDLALRFGNIIGG